MTPVKAYAGINMLPYQQNRSQDVLQPRLTVGRILFSTEISVFNSGAHKLGVSTGRGGGSGEQPHQLNLDSNLLKSHVSSTRTGPSLCVVIFECCVKQGIKRASMFFCLLWMHSLLQQIIKIIIINTSYSVWLHGMRPNIDSCRA